MADYGFRVFGETGSIQFSNNIKNLCLSIKGVSTTWTPFTSLISGVRRWDITYTRIGNVMPLIAIAPSQRVAAVSRTVSGNVHTWSFLSWSDVDEIPYYIFDEIGTNPGGYGIVVYDNDGDIAYHSSRLPLRIAPPLITSDMPFMTWEYVTTPNPVEEVWALPSGRTYAAIFGTVSHYLTYMYLGAGNYSLGSNIVAMRFSGNTLITDGRWTSRESATTTTPDRAREVYNKRRSIIPIDVTHY